MTNIDKPKRYIFEISTHTLTWSVTLANFRLRQRLNFNSHAHVERDGAVGLRPFQTAISTHTLTWSVTLEYLRKHRLSNFNSHAHVERDRFFLVTIYSINISTHTLTWSVT